MKKISILLAILAVASIASAGQVINPSERQSPEQQKEYEAACYTWAVDQSNYDPANAPSAPQIVVQTTQHSGPTGAHARGALRGAAIGEIAGGDAGEAALACAAMAGSRERRQNSAANQQAQAVASQQKQSAVAEQQAGQVVGILSNKVFKEKNASYCSTGWLKDTHNKEF